MTMAGDGEVLTGLWFDGQRHFGAGLPPGTEGAELPVFRDTARWLDIYFSGREPSFSPPMQPSGTPFQQTVWSLLLTIPYGQTTTYGALAAQTAACLRVSTMSAQAVGGAVGRNPISILIPCHRVLGADGKLTGYAGGVDKKAVLLRLET